jgi:putative membrane protein
MTPSERRLHPLSFLFDVGGQLRQLVVPGLVVLIGAGSAGWDWQAGFMLLVIPYAVVAIVRSLSFRYRFDPSELVITRGFIFRNERHVPYARIHNIDAVQNVLHRLLRVVEVRVETGGGDEPEARMRVLPMSALDEMRDRVFAGRQMPGSGVADEPVVLPRSTLLKLTPRELLLAGFIDSRGLIIAGAAFGLLWEVGLFDPTLDLILGENTSGRGMVRQAVRGLFGGGTPPLTSILLMAGAFAALLLVMRALSMVWSFVRLYGFTLDRAGEDLRTEFGLFTRVMATIPLHRIQTVTIREGPLHRLFEMASVRVDSAGSDGGAAGAAGARRESLAPIVRRQMLRQLFREVLPGIEITDIVWRPVDPRGFHRAFRASLVLALILTLPFVVMLKWWTLALLMLLTGWAYLHARLYVKHLGWALVDGAVAFRNGYLWKHVSIARYAKMQVVTLNESPFDRRAKMANVRVDTAGASDASHRVDIPYLARDTAQHLYHFLASQAARTPFRW